MRETGRSAISQESMEDEVERSKIGEPVPIDLKPMRFRHQVRQSLAGEPVVEPVPSRRTARPDS